MNSHISVCYHVTRAAEPFARYTSPANSGCEAGSGCCVRPPTHERPPPDFGRIREKRFRKTLRSRALSESLIRLRNRTFGRGNRVLAAPWRPTKHPPGTPPVPGAVNPSDSPSFLLFIPPHTTGISEPLRSTPARTHTELFLRARCETPIKVFQVVICATPSSSGVL